MSETESCKLRKTYKCLDCEEEFDEPEFESSTQREEFWGETVVHEVVIERCPWCYSDDIELPEDGDPDPNEGSVEGHQL